MARYDRIARIDPPDRGDTFSGWMALCDLEGRERNTQLGRRARLRFLALRPVRRLIERGPDAFDDESVRQQLDFVREEIDSLPAADPERRCLLNFLREMVGRSPGGVVRATLDVGGSAEEAGHTYAAEEYYLTALELATAHDLPDLQVRALRRLGGVHASRESWERSLAQYRRAAELAGQLPDPQPWARAMEGIAAIHGRRGEATASRRVLDEIEGRGLELENDRVRAIAAGARCTLELAAGNLDAAVRNGWDAVQWFQGLDAPRADALMALAAAFRRAGQTPAAEAAYEAVAGTTARAEQRSRAVAEHAITAAEAGDAAEFHARRDRILAEAYPEDPQLAALLHLRLGRGCTLVGDVDAAREHLRKAIGTARDGAYDSVLQQAEELLGALESGGREDGRRTGSGATDLSPDIRRIAEQVETLGRELVASA